MSSVSLVWITNDAEKTMEFCARVSSPQNQKKMESGELSPGKLLRYCADKGHVSIFEMASACVSIATTRDISAQIIRHRSFSFQEFCVAAGTMVSYLKDRVSKRRKPVEQIQVGDMVRTWCEETKTFVYAPVSAVCRPGVKDTVRLTLTNGKELVCTKEHRVMTRGGFVPVSELSPGDVVGCNGAPCHQSLEWMAQAKQECVRNGSGVQGMANRAGVSYHTIRKWLRIHQLQFTSPEIASCRPVWNKGLPKPLQPKYGKKHSLATREKMSLSARHGEDSNPFTGRPPSWRKQVANWARAQRRYLENECADCGKTERLEIDHVVPVSEAPEKALDFSNLQVLCQDCHKEKSRGEGVATTVQWALVESIQPGISQEVYDLEVACPSHSYIANGIVTHNSTRYAKVTDRPEVPELRIQAETNRQSSIKDQSAQLAYEEEVHEHLQETFELYDRMIQHGVARECARRILPMCTPTRIYMAGTIRSWIHYFAVRCTEATQAEHREVALKARALLARHLPLIAEAFDWNEE